MYNEISGNCFCSSVMPEEIICPMLNTFISESFLFCHAAMFLCKLFPKNVGERQKECQSDDILERKLKCYFTAYQIKGRIQAFSII